MKEHLITKGVEMILQGLEVDLKDRNYTKTPIRVMEFYKELFNRKPTFPPVFEDSYNEMIVLKNHQAWALCPHHLLPVHLTISIGYLPSGKGVVGLSKLARIADMCLDIPIMQETLTRKITALLELKMRPLGAGCVIEGQHLCMQMRGIKTTGTVTTSSMKGAFLTEPAARLEFLNLINGK